MKKTFAVVLAIMMLVCALSACGTAKTEEETETPAVSEEVTTPEEGTTEGTTESDAPVESEDPAVSPEA